VTSGRCQSCTSHRARTHCACAALSPHHSAVHAPCTPCATAPHRASWAACTDAAERVLPRCARGVGADACLAGARFDKAGPTDAGRPHARLVAVPAAHKVDAALRCGARMVAGACMATTRHHMSSWGGVGAVCLHSMSVGAARMCGGPAGQDKSNTRSQPFPPTDSLTIPAIVQLAHTPRSATWPAEHTAAAGTQVWSTRDLTKPAPPWPAAHPAVMSLQERHLQHARPQQRQHLHERVRSASTCTSTANTCKTRTCCSTARTPSPPTALLNQ
jgi:hypothetical protein